GLGLELDCFLGGVARAREVPARFDQPRRQATQGARVARPLLEGLAELLERARIVAHHELRPAALRGGGPSRQVQRRLRELLVERRAGLSEVGALAGGPVAGDAA